jgi:hypothetical protein
VFFTAEHAEHAETCSDESGQSFIKGTDLPFGLRPGGLGALGGEL